MNGEKTEPKPKGYYTDQIVSGFLFAFGAATLYWLADKFDILTELGLGEDEDEDNE